MKNLLQIMAVFGLLLFHIACTSDTTELEQNDTVALEIELLNEPCLDEDPVTRLVNNGTIEFDLIVLDEDGNVMVSIISIPPNSTTSWASFTQGEVLFSVSNNTPFVNDDKVLLEMANCMALEIEINGDNEVVSYTPTVL
jgi:hypothetical protein